MRSSSLPERPTNGGPLDVFLVAGRLADEHHARLRIAVGEDELRRGARSAQPSKLSSSARSSSRLLALAGRLARRHDGDIGRRRCRRRRRRRRARSLLRSGSGRRGFALTRPSGDRWRAGSGRRRLLRRPCGRPAARRAAHRRRRRGRRRGGRALLWVRQSSVRKSTRSQMAVNRNGSRKASKEIVLSRIMDRRRRRIAS